MINVKVLPGAEEFSELRQGKYYYVDKTDFLNRFFSPPPLIESGPVHQTTPFWKNHDHVHAVRVS